MSESKSEVKIPEHNSGGPIEPENNYNLILLHKYKAKAKYEYKNNRE